MIIEWQLLRYPNSYAYFQRNRGWVSGETSLTQNGRKSGHLSFTRLGQVWIPYRVHLSPLKDRLVSETGISVRWWWACFAGMRRPPPPLFALWWQRLHRNQWVGGGQRWGPQAEHRVSAVKRLFIWPQPPTYGVAKRPHKDFCNTYPLFVDRIKEKLHYLTI